MTTTSTKDRILDAALALFNAEGTAAATTNHIAAALGMSPGNLYYHFRNKAEIVRELFGRIMAEWAENYAVPERQMPDLAMLEAMLAGNFRIQWRYRFFFRDLTSLLQADPELASVYRANRAAGMANTLGLTQLFVAAGVIEDPGGPEAIEEIAGLLWMVGDFWLVFKDAGGGPIGQPEMDEGVRAFRRILTPYLKGHDT